MNFWEQDCPERGPALRHAHSQHCEQDHIIPSHAREQCCHCGDTAEAWRVRAAYEAKPVEQADDDIADDTPLELEQPGRTCIIDHRSVKDGRLIGDEGEEWPTCHICDTQVEPQMITGKGPQGTEHGPGRGELTPRIKDRLIKVRAFYDWQAQQQ